MITAIAVLAISTLLLIVAHAMALAMLGVERRRTQSLQHQLNALRNTRRLGKAWERAVADADAALNLATPRPPTGTP